MSGITPPGDIDDAEDAGQLGCIIAYRNLADSGTLSAETDVDPAYPLERLQTRQLGDFSRTLTVGHGGIATLIIVCDLLEAQPVDVIALLGVNRAAGRGELVQIESSDDGVLFEARDGYDVGGSDSGVPQLPASLVSILPDTVAARYWRLAWQWSVGDAGVGDSGRLWIGPAIRVPQGCEEGWGLTADDPGTVDSSAGRQWYETSMPRTRRLTVSLSQIEADIAFGMPTVADIDPDDIPSLQGLQMEAGVTGEVIVLPRTSSRTWIRRLGVYGHLDRVPEIRHMGGDYYSTTLTVVEER